MKCAIMQPTYLPWAGYFNLISSVDKFIFLDDVQFERRSWQSRNRILLNGKEHLLSVATIKAPQKEKIKNILLSNDSNWKLEHWKTISQAYCKSPFGTEVLTLLENAFFNEKIDNLSEFNISIIKKISTSLKLDAKFYKASDFNTEFNRTKHLIELADLTLCKSYLSPVGSKDYLEEDGFETLTNIALSYQDFTPKKYAQYKITEFISHLSIIDVIANLGIERTRDYIL